MTQDIIRVAIAHIREVVTIRTVEEQALIQRKNF
jgi:hypothetical protein